MRRKSSIVILLAIIGIAAALLASTQVFAGTCVGAAKASKKCFTTASGYIFRIVEGGNCLGQTVTGFPTYLEAEEKYLWCWEVESPSGRTSALNQVSLQVPIPLIFPAPPQITMDSSGQIFSYSDANGCGGDSTSGFETGDKEECGVKWVFRLNPGGNTNRFWMKTSVAAGAGPQVMAPRVGSSLEPELILAPDESSPFTPRAQNYCQTFEGMPIKFETDERGCLKKAYQCGAGDTNCTGTCTLLTPQTFNIQVREAGGTNVFAATLREIGFIGSNQKCPQGYFTIANSPGCTLIGPIGGQYIKYPPGCTN